MSDTDRFTVVDARWLDDALALMQQVAEHFDTDAPLGLEARRLFYEAGR